ncbi:MAG: cupin domain-containing protein [Aliivibrio sp.]|uniref:ribosomal protein uL16 3-hydroxylase n=1 Tax=Aliivibrio sp. TaxID=1872443 RepID=UPI001A3F0FBC|nr:cupin domain-containing protein [Aliivibrio sp.]
MYQLSFSLEEFLAEFWQKKPTIIKGGFKNFQDPISADELAGLSMEEEIDSRFVSNANDQWDAKHGPFDETLFNSLTEKNWTLIVQAANHWHPASAQLVTPFRQLSNWLLDDLMISYAVEGGGVGPHIDQYDVFITQGEGSRRWRVGAKDEGQYVETSRHSALRQIEGFDPIIDQTLETGDILYIPPGFPHDGYALEPSISYSVGFRSPTEQELLSNFADYVISNDIGENHMHQPSRQIQAESGTILTNDLQQLTEMLTSSLQNPTVIKDYMGCLLSQSRHIMDIALPEEDWEASEVHNLLMSGDRLVRIAGLRALYNQGEESTVYINGEVFTVAEDETDVVLALCNDEILSKENLGEQVKNPAAIALITQLVNKGYWYSAE